MQNTLHGQVLILFMSILLHIEGNRFYLNMSRYMFYVRALCFKSKVFGRVGLVEDCVVVVFIFRVSLEVCFL